MTLTDRERIELLHMARNAIVTAIEPGLKADQASPLAESLHLPTGVFVSLYVKGKLRGCIGTFSEEEPLFKNVRVMAVSAATNDSRFSPIVSNDLDHLNIEISVLTPRIPVSDISEISIGKDGIYMERDFSRGTFLPQVATNQQWSLEEFLGNCAKYKAGIGWDGWKTADLYRYKAIIFSSADFPGNC